MSSITSDMRIGSALDFYQSASSGLPYMFFAGALSQWEENWPIRSIVPGVTTNVVLQDDHGVAIGDSFSIDNVDGMTQINGVTGQIVSVLDNVVTVEIDSTTFNTYTSGGTLTIYKDKRDENLPSDEIKRRILSLKVIDGSMMCPVVRRIDWENGKRFDALSPDENMIGKNFYCYSRGAIYVCLDNAGNLESKFRPTGFSLVPQSYPDGFVWKFAYRVDSSDMVKFGDDRWIPVRPRLYQNPSRGSIYALRMNSRGTKYRHNDVLKIAGDGDSASFAIGRFFTNGAIMSTVPLNRGKNYTWARAWIEPSDGSQGSGASLTPIISSHDEFIDPTKELFCTNIKMVIDLDRDEDGKIYTSILYSAGIIRPDVSRKDLIRSKVMDVRSRIDLAGSGLEFQTGAVVEGLISGTRAICAGTEDNSIFVVEEKGKGFIDGEIIVSGTKNALSTKIDRANTEILQNASFIVVDSIGRLRLNDNQKTIFNYVISF